MKIFATSKGRITIPAKLREKYGIKNGTRIIMLEQEGSIVLKALTEQSLRSLQGSLKGKGGLKVLLEERRSIMRLE